MGYITYKVSGDVQYVAFNTNSEQQPRVVPGTTVTKSPDICGELEQTLNPPFQARIEARGRNRQSYSTIAIYEDGERVALATGYGTALAECTYGVTTD